MAEVAGMRRWLNRVVASIVVVIASGFASAFFSAHRCEDEVAAGLASRFADGPVFGRTPEARAILERSGLKANPCGKEGDCVPWVDVSQAMVAAPFLVDVRWGFAGDPINSQYLRSRYLTVFGAVFHLSDIVTTVTF